MIIWDRNATRVCIIMNNTNRNLENAGLYIRVSTMNQLDRDSLKTQEDRLIAFCVANGIKQHRLYKDPGFSAKDTKRPALEALMKDIQDGEIKNVFTVKLDRITRSLADLLHLTNFFNKYSVNFVSISENIDTSTAMGRAMHSLLGIFAQLEREVTAERVATDMRHRANNGKWNGGVVPYGYTIQSRLKKKYKENGIEPIKAMEICPETKKLYVDLEESEIVKWIYETYLKTNSIRKTTIDLNGSGVRTRDGKLWAKTTIHRFLTNPTYAGMIWYGKRKTDPISGKLIGQDKNEWVIVKGEHDPIISEETFNAVQELISKKHGKPTRSNRTYLLSGILKCGHCGGAMTGHTFNRKGTDRSYSYYKCYSKLQKGPLACAGLSLPTDKLENYIIDQLMHLSENKTFLSDKKKMLQILKSKEKKDSSNIEIINIDKHIRGLSARLDTLLDKMERQLITDEDFKPRYEKIKGEMSELSNKKDYFSSLERSSQLATANLEASFEEIASFKNNWEYLDDVGKSLRVNAIVKEIRATKEKIDLDIFLDVANMSRTDMDSWQR